jgi:hypothetical protein
MNNTINKNIPVKKEIFFLESDLKPKYVIKK